MNKLSENASRLMLESGKKIISKNGCSGLSIRKMANMAGVNLGTFHYHFKSKERFKKILLQEVYDGFFARLLVASKEGGTAIAQLRASLLVMGGFIREEQGLCLALFRDIFNEDAEVLSFVRKNVPRHGAVLRDLILRCQKEGSIAKLPAHQALVFLVTSMNVPTVVGYALKKRANRSVPKMPEMEMVISPGGIAQRIDLALKGLRP
jgi:AcrR family transcriptional regulator